MQIRWISLRGWSLLFRVAFDVKVVRLCQKFKDHVTENEHLADFIEFFRHKFL